MSRSVIVLGAGMVGVSTAWHLLQRGFSVTLVDRKGPGQETSYGNAGLIQREAVEPYPFPHDWEKMVEVLRRKGNDVAYDLMSMPGLASPLLRYWWMSGGKRYRRISLAYAAMIRHCLDEHEPMIEASGGWDLVRRIGWKLVVLTDQQFDEEARRAERLSAEFGVRSVVMDQAALAKAEPGLRVPMTGAIHWTDPWSVRDPGALVERYAAMFGKAGGKITLGNAETLAQKGAGWSVMTQDGQLEAASVVVALGPWSDTLLRRFGYRLPLFAKRGYHRHYEGESMLNTPMLDSVAGAMAVPMARGMRITTGAEFNKVGASPNYGQMVRAEIRWRELIEMGNAVETDAWLGNRPCTGDMLPVIGAAPKHGGMWFHFGHAHQGFTLGPATGRLLAEMMNGETPYIDPTPYRPTRFG